MEKQIFDVDGVTYTLRPSNFIDAKKHAFNLVALLKGAVKTKEGNFDIDVGAVLANIGSAEMQGIEAFVLKYLEASSDGEAILLRDAAVSNAHFNAYRSHYLQVIFEGLKYHFLPFLPNGGGLLESMSAAGVMQGVMK